MGYFIIFVLSGLIGFAIGGIVAIFTTRCTVERVVCTHGINADELVAWIENYQHNYEWVSPPTTAEIIKRIQEMKNAGESEVM